MTRIPWRLLGGAVVIALAAITVLSFISDPFGIRSFFRERLENRAEYAENDAANLRTAADADAITAQRVDTFHRQEIIIREATAQAQTEARNAPDADTPLSDERANRLRSHDQRLLDSFPGFTTPAPADAPR